jgi:hypothetical protein
MQHINVRDCGVFLILFSVETLTQKSRDQQQSDQRQESLSKRNKRNYKSFDNDNDNDEMKIS